VLLVLSLAINIALLTRVNNIEDTINDRLIGVDELRSLTQQNNDRINQAMNIIETEQRWITPVEIADVKQEGSSFTVKLSWVIKDYPGNAPVTFHYRKQGEKEFTSRQAASAGDGRFEIELTDNMKTEPDWQIQTTYFGGNDGDSKTSRANQIAKAINSRQSMEYYITVKDGVSLKSSEIASLDLEKLSSGIYTPLSIELQVNQKTQRYSVFLSQFSNGPKQVKLTRAYLEAFSGNQVISRSELTEDKSKPDNSVIMLNTEWNYENLSFDRVFLTVEYANGKQFKREISGRP
jgi:hypothetical protein